MPKTLLQKLNAREWEKWTEEEKRDFLDGHAKRVGDIVEAYNLMEKQGLERARKTLIYS